MEKSSISLYTIIHKNPEIRDIWGSINVFDMSVDH